MICNEVSTQYTTTAEHQTVENNKIFCNLWFLSCVVAVSVPCQDQDKVWTTDNFIPSSVSLPECHIYYFSVFQTLRCNTIFTEHSRLGNSLGLGCQGGWWICNWNEVIVGYVYQAGFVWNIEPAVAAVSQSASQYHINTDPPRSLWSFILTIRVRDLEKIIKQN